MEVVAGVLAVWFLTHLAFALLGSTNYPIVPLKDNQTTISTKRKAYTNTAEWPPEKPSVNVSEYVGDVQEDSNYTTYHDYISSSAVWQSKRLQRLEIDNHTCQGCGSKNNLHVHHITYKNLFNENVSKELVTVCKTCHNATHESCGKDAGYYPIK